MRSSRPDVSEVSWREVAAVTAGALLFSVATTWPLVLRWRTHVVQDDGDPLLQAWQVAWTGRSLAADASAIFQANTFWPLPDSLAFSDSLLGYAPAGLVGSGLQAATVRHGLLTLFALVLAAVAGHLLAREVGVRPLAALVAGAVFSFAPWRLSHLGHLNILSSGGMALTFFLLARGHRRRSWPTVLAGWLVASWQLSIGLGASLFFAYALLAAAVVTAVWWWRAGRPAVERSLVWASTGGVAVLLVTVGLHALPYLRVLADHPELVRSVGYLELYSPPPRGLLAAPASSWLWGPVTAPLREGMVWAPEQTRFVGLTAIVLAGVGAVRGDRGRWVRGFLVVAVLVTGVLALGTGLAGGRFTYLPLFEVAPGWDGIRTPGRWMTLTTLALGLLAALGADRWLGERGDGVGGTARRRLLVGALVVAVLVEGLGRTPVVEVPVPEDEAVFAVEGPRLHLPSTVTGDQVYMLWTTERGFPPVVNGASGFVPEELDQLRRDVAGFPDAPSVALLRGLGVRSVVLHPSRAGGTPWAGAEERSVAGLGVDRRTVAGAVVYDLGG